MANLLFSFDDLGSKSDKALAKLKQYFSRAGCPVVKAEPGGKTLRTSGVSYRELALTFGDSQQVVLRVKQTGDVYQVLVNGSVTPIRHQDDHVRAIAEVCGKLESGRQKFQKKLAAVATKLPPSIRTAAPTMEAKLKQRVQELDDAIDAAKQELAALGAA